MEEWLNQVTHFIGIDVSKDTLDICIRQRKKSEVSLQVANTAAGLEALCKLLVSHGATTENSVCCMEQTGCYDDHVLETLTVKGWTCALEKTTAIKRVRAEHHRKADRYDAKLLAEYALRFLDKLSIYQSAHPVVEQIRVLSRERRRLVTDRAAATSLLQQECFRAGVNDFAVSLWQQQVSFYSTQIGQIEARIEELLNRDEELSRRYEQVKGIDGIGPKTAVFWVCLFAGQQKINARQVASLFGFAPHAETSGTSLRRKGRSTGHGNREARKLFHLCAESAMVHHQKYRHYRERKRAQGKIHAVIKNNVVNKLIRVICSVWNQDSTYDPDYVSVFVPQAA